MKDKIIRMYVEKNMSTGFIASLLKMGAKEVCDILRKEGVLKKRKGR